MTNTNEIYCNLLNLIQCNGELVPGRNHPTRRLITLPLIVFNSTPLVTVRRTAWRKAILEMEWFLSGSPECPPELYDWWEAQLSPNKYYHRGYGDQLRRFAGHCPIAFDQITNLIEGIRTHPYSRRHVITTWHPGEMSIITEINQNPLTPTTCHTTVAQFFVSREGLLSLHSYQRSADMLLGVPHNWIQSWALLLWIAAHTETIPDKLLWTFGDAHIYQEPSHLEAISQITDPRFSYTNTNARLTYTGKVNEFFKPFKADDFEMIGTIPAPISTIRPKLL